MVIVKRAVTELPPDRRAEFEAIALWRCRDGRLAFDARDPRYLAILKRRAAKVAAPTEPAAADAQPNPPPITALPAAVSPTSLWPTCRHRGGEIGEGDCITCRGRVVVKVWACALHRRCCVDRTTEGVRSCGECADRSPPSSPTT